MGLIRKSQPDMDYTLLQKKGILKKSVEEKLPFKMTKEGDIDLTHLDNSSNSGMAANPFGFLDSLAGASALDSPLSSSNNNSSDADSDISTLKIKIDDLEYKLARLIERLESLESRK